MDEGGKRFRAFVSYSHVDKPFALRLHDRLERFNYPKALTRNGTPKAVFIDRHELAAAEDLPQALRDALAASGALVVVASPAAKQSRWVDQEIILFKKLNPDLPVLVALVVGEPKDALPSALVDLSNVGPEPLAADYRQGGDGRRLADLKLLAGMAGIPLDRLLQRDAQRKLRRVIAVTVLTALITLWSLAAAVTALRARAEAVARRNESEALVEFMLTDLRQKLKGVGRLDVMQSVNHRVLEHYNQATDDELPMDTLERRSRALTAIGEDTLKEGDRAAAARFFAASYALSTKLAKRSPLSAQVAFDLAQNDYWLGFSAFLSNDYPKARLNWTKYLTDAERLRALDPKSAQGQAEVGYAQADLCALSLESPGTSGLEISMLCDKAIAIARAAAERSPNDLQTQLDYLNAMGWNADAALRAGKFEKALYVRLEQRARVQMLRRRFITDIRVVQAELLVLIGLTRAAARDGDRSLAQASLKRAKHVSLRIGRLDPQNQNWRAWRQQLEKLTLDLKLN